MADAVERITNLVALLLETRAPLTADQIATELRGQYPAGTAALRGAFERDKALLREIGVPLEQAVLAGADAGRTAYWIDRRRYELADLELADDERAALELAVAAARLGDAQFGLLKLGAQGRGGAARLAGPAHRAVVPDRIVADAFLRRLQRARSHSALMDLAHRRPGRQQNQHHPERVHAGRLRRPAPIRLALPRTGRLDSLRPAQLV